MFELLFTHPLWAYRTGVFAFASAWPLWLLVVSILVGGRPDRRDPVATSAARLAPAAAGRGAADACWRLPSCACCGGRCSTSSACGIARTCSRSPSTRPRAWLTAKRSGRGCRTSRRLCRMGRSRSSKTRSKCACSASRRPTTPLDSLDAIPRARAADAHRRCARPGAAECRQHPARRRRAVQRRRGERRLAERGTPDGDRLLRRAGAHRRRRAGAGRATIWSSSASTSPRARRPARRSLRRVGIRHQGAGATRLRVYDRDTLVAARDMQLPPDSDRDEPDDRSAGRRAPARTSCASRSIRSKASATRSTTRARASSMCRRPGATFCTSKASRAGNTSSCGAPRNAIARCASRAWCARRRTSITARASTRLPSWSRAFRPSAAELFAYDAVIIGSYEAASLRAEQHRLLKEFVDQRGGSVLMLAGRYGLAAGGWQNAALAQTLPVQLAGRQVTATSCSAPAHAQLDDLRRRVADPAPRRGSAAQCRALEEPAGAGGLPDAGPAQARRDRAAGSECASARRTPLLRLAALRPRRDVTCLRTASTLRWQMQLPPEDESHEIFWRQLLHAIAATAPPRASLDRRTDSSTTTSAACGWKRNCATSGSNRSTTRASNFR